MKYFFLLFPLLSFADAGQVRIFLKDKKAVVENSNCYPVLVSVNEKVLALPKKSSQILNAGNWSKWDWMPGTTGETSSRSVISPLKSTNQVSFGPGVGIHVDGLYNSYDFSVPEGTAVYPVEAGIVIKTVDRYELAHQDKSKLHEVNSVEILHLDGTVARYMHLKKDSIKVKECEIVEIDDVLALSGNTGFSSGPHLHVDVYRAKSGTEFMALPLVFAPRN